MDFTSALENLQRAANALQKNQDHRHSSSGGNDAVGVGNSYVRVDQGTGSSIHNRSGHHHRQQRRFDDHRGRRPRDESRGRQDERPCEEIQRRRITDSFTSHMTGSEGRGRNGIDQRLALLEPMIRFGYRVNSYRPPIIAPQALHRREEGPAQAPLTRHICLLVLSINDLPYEHIWKAWVANSADDSVYVSMVGHAKYSTQVQSEWFKSKLLTRRPTLGRGNSFAPPEYFSYAPEWGSIFLTRAMIELLVQGLKIGQPPSQSGFNADERGGRAGLPVEDPRFSPSRHVIRSPAEKLSDNVDQSFARQRPPQVDAFVFVSDSCLPVRSLDECVTEIFHPNHDDEDNEHATGIYSWTLARTRGYSPNTPRNMYEKAQFGDIHRMIPGQYRTKSDQWILLNRPHATAILNMDRHLRESDQLWNSFAKISASDEMYFPTCMAVLGIISPNGINDQLVKRKQVTYVDWSEGMRNPASFSAGAVDFGRVAQLARCQGCLLARKFVLISPGRNQVTGSLSVDEWNSEIARLEAMDATSISHAC